MDDEENCERIKTLGFKPQKEKAYDRLLPYGEQLDDEAIKLYRDIKTNLIKSIVAREVRPGITLWTSRLNKYIKIYGLKFSKEDHIAWIKLFYNMLMIPNLDPPRINKFAGTLSLLLKKRCLISQAELQLDWRPFYDLCVRVLEKSKKELEMYNYNSNLETYVGSVIRYAKVYFPLTATQEIFDEFRPFLFPYNDSDITNGTQYLELFLPVIIKPEDANRGYKLWFNELMDFWEKCQNGGLWENQIMWLMARLSFNNIGHIDWEQYIPIMFTRFLITLNLPVNFKKGAIKTYLKLDVSAVCVWIISILGGPRDVGFDQLEKFMQTLESYYHPANTGLWTMKIREFLKKISYYFVQRVYIERYKKRSWQYAGADDYQLTDEQIDRFVNIMKPSVDMAIFSRLGYQNVSAAVQYLANLRPNIICPIVLEKLYASMDTLTEPHKLTSSIMCLNAVARYLVQGGTNNYPEGPTHVVPLLMALLPGIDPNDIRKCFMTFNFLTYFINMVPLINSSDASKYYDDLTEVEHIICEASAGFEDFVVQLFDRLCSWIESNSQEFTRLEQTEQDNKTVTETMAESAVVSVITSILTQSSPDIFQVLLKKMYNFATSRIFELKVSGNMVATICQAFVGINPKETMKLFMPHLCETVERLLDETDDLENEENLNQELLYNLLLLTRMVEARDELLNYIDRLSNVLDKTLHMKSVVGSKMGTHMLGVIMASLSSITPTEYRSLPTPYDSHIKNNLTIRQWGIAGDLRNLNMSWYVPGEKEIACVQTLLNRYLIPELDRLNRFANGDEPLSRETLRCSLNIVISTLGSHPLLPQWNEPALNLIDSVIDAWSFDLIVGPKSNITLPDGRNVRKTIVDTVHRVQRKIMTDDESDTKSIRAVMMIYDTILFNKFKAKDYESRRKHFHVLKKYLEDRLHQKKTHLRFVLVNRVLLHQLFRIESRNCFFTATHKQILLDLFELAVSRYSEIRLVAQSKLAAIITTVPYSYTLLMPRIKELLTMDPTEHHETFKGCLYVLLNPKNASLVTRHDWQLISELWPLIIASKPSEKLSIVNLMNTIIDSVHRNFPTLGIALRIPDSCLMKAQDLCKTTPVVRIDNLAEIVRVGLANEDVDNEMRLRYYHAAVNNLLKLVTCENLHWRHYSMALGFLRDLVHPDVKYNAEVVEFFLKCLIHESIVVRKIAIKAVLFIVIQNKPKFVKITIDPYRFNDVANVQNAIVKPGIRPDNKWLLYDSNTLPRTDTEWDEPRFIHNQHVGFYSWPKTLEVYAKAEDQPTPSKRMDKLTRQEQMLFTFFSDDKYVSTLISYLSMEEKKGKDLFNGQRFLLFKNLFKIFEDKLLHVFLPHLQRLVESKQEHHQRCAAEIISGFIRGSKHWNFQQVERLWTEIIPLLRVALNNLATETVPDWSFCVTMGVECRDPNRHYWLLEFLLDNPLNETSSFVSSGRLIMLKTVLQRQSWRNVELYNRLLAYFQKYMTQPFQNVREKISSCLASIFSSDLIFPNGYPENIPRIHEFFDAIAPQLNNFYEDTLKQLEHSNNNDNTHGTTDKALTRQTRAASLDDGEKEAAVRLFKIIALYVIESISHVNSSAIPEYFKLLPLACIQQSSDVDDELANISLGFLSILSHTITLSRHVPDALEAIRQVSKCPSWSARESIAEFISVFVFHNMATLTSKEEWIREIQDIVLELVEDRQPEVRVQASRVLSDLLQCQFVPDPSELLANYKVKAKTKLRKRNPNKSANATATSDRNGGIRLRHAGVLGMCAFISSHPYDVPDFLPGIFGELGPHLNDPQPIPATIRKTLGDFKRTHHDNWEVHKLKFTDDELSLLSDLTVPPTYYA